MWPRRKQPMDEIGFWLRLIFYQVICQSVYRRQASAFCDDVGMHGCLSYHCSRKQDIVAKMRNLLDESSERHAGLKAARAMSSSACIVVENAARPRRLYEWPARAVGGTADVVTPTRYSYAGHYRRRLALLTEAGAPAVSWNSAVLVITMKTYITASVQGGSFISAGIRSFTKPALRRMLLRYMNDGVDIFRH